MFGWGWSKRECILKQQIGAGTAMHCNTTLQGTTRNYKELQGTTMQCNTTLQGTAAAVCKAFWMQCSAAVQCSGYQCSKLQVHRYRYTGAGTQVHRYSTGKEHQMSCCTVPPLASATSIRVERKGKLVLIQCNVSFQIFTLLFISNLPFFNLNFIIIAICSH